MCGISGRAAGRWGRRLDRGKRTEWLVTAQPRDSSGWPRTGGCPWRILMPMAVLTPGLVQYADALALQHRLVDARRAGAVDDTLILLQHPPVLTIGRGGGEENVTASGAMLSRMGIDVVHVERGGNVTYHGPGQVVGYLIADLATDARARDLHRFLRDMEEMLIRAVATFGVRATRNPGKTGIWVEGQKLASIGVAVRRWVTFHGFALNVRTDLAHFNLIVPCGLQDVRMCSLESLAGTGDPGAPVAEAPSLEGVHAAIIEEARDIFGLDPRPVVTTEDALLAAR